MPRTGPGGTGGVARSVACPELMEHVEMCKAAPLEERACSDCGVQGMSLHRFSIVPDFWTHNQDIRALAQLEANYTRVGEGVKHWVIFVLDNGAMLGMTEVWVYLPHRNYQRQHMVFHLNQDMRQLPIYLENALKECVLELVNATTTPPQREFISYGDCIFAALIMPNAQMMTALTTDGSRLKAVERQ